MTRRRVTTWLVVVALAAIGLVAAADSVLGDRQRPAARDAPAAAAPLLARQPELAVSRLREAGVTGVITYSDGDCRLHAVTLPELRPAPAPSIQVCRPPTRTGGLGAFRGDVVWAGLGYGIAQTVLTRAELSRAIRKGLGIPVDDEAAGFRALQAVPLDGPRYAVLAESTYEPRERVLVGFEGKRTAFVQPRWVVRDAVALRPSPLGGYFAAFTRSDGRLVLFRGDGSPTRLPNVPPAHAVAWSPDERLTALATERSVYVYPTERPEELVVRIPLAVRDLDWDE